MTKDKVIQQMREALEDFKKTDLPLSKYVNAGHESLEDAIDAALAASKAVEPQPERQPLTDEQRIQNLADLTRWLDGLGSNIHTYSLRGIALAAWEAHSKAVEPQPEREPYTADPSCKTVDLAEMILSDCGCSTNNSSLVSRVANRIDQVISAALREKNGGQQ